MMIVHFKFLLYLSESCPQCPTGSTCPTGSATPSLQRQCTPTILRSWTRPSPSPSRNGQPSPGVFCQPLPSDRDHPWFYRYIQGDLHNLPPQWSIGQCRPKRRPEHLLPWSVGHLRPRRWSGDMLPWSIGHLRPKRWSGNLLPCTADGLYLPWSDDYPKRQWTCDHIQHPKPE